MSVREGNRLLVVNNLLRAVCGGDLPAQLRDTLYEACRGLEFGEDRKLIHFRMRVADKSVRLEIKAPERCEAILLSLVQQLLTVANVPQDDVERRLASDVVPHVQAYVAHRHGAASAQNVDALIVDTTVWLAMRLDEKLERAAAEQLVARMLAPPRKYAAPRSLQEFLDLESVYFGAKDQYKRARVE